MEPRSILITGASSGIGRALALHYAGAGTFLALSGRDSGRLATVAQACRARGADVATETVDVRNRDAMSAWISGVDEEHPLDLIVANAGVSGGTGDAGDPQAGDPQAGNPQAGEEEAQVREIFAVNLSGVLNTVWPALPSLRARSRGQIAIISSLAGFIGLPGAPAYGASKAAVRSYGEGLRGWLAGEGIRVSVVCPGFVESRITAQNTFPMPFFMTAEKAAAIIARGLARNQGRIAFPWPMALTMGLLNALPAEWASRLMRRAPKKT
jgi:short-subunit dehydrogenase